MILDDIEALRRKQDYQLDRVLDEEEAAEKQRFEAEIMAIPRRSRELQNIFPGFGVLLSSGFNACRRRMT